MNLTIFTTKFFLLVFKGLQSVSFKQNKSTRKVLDSKFKNLSRFQYLLNCNPSPPLFSAEFSTIGFAVLLDEKEVSVSDSGFAGLVWTGFLGPLTFSQHLSNLDSQQILLSGQVPNLLVHEKKSQVQSAMEKEANRQRLNPL